MAESQPKEYPGEQPCKSWQNQDQGYKGSTRDNQKRQFRLKVYVFYLRELAHVYAKGLLTYGNHNRVPQNNFQTGKIRVFVIGLRCRHQIADLSESWRKLSRQNEKTLLNRLAASATIIAHGSRLIAY